MRGFFPHFFSLIQSRPDDFHAGTETLLKVLAWISERSRGDGGRGSRGKVPHLDRDFQLWLLSPFSSPQGRQRPQQLQGFAAQAVVPRALRGVGAGPGGKAVPPHPHRALPARELELIPAQTRGITRNEKGEPEFKGTSHTCSTPTRTVPGTPHWAVLPQLGKQLNPSWTRLESDSSAVLLPFGNFCFA